MDKKTLEQIGYWLIRGRAVEPAEVMLATALGFKCESPAPPPRNIDDFGRCFYLIQVAPSVFDLSAKRLSESCTRWQTFIENWAELAETYEDKSNPNRHKDFQQIMTDIA
jgi:hypothetical protein